MEPINKKDEKEVPKPAMPQPQPAEGPMPLRKTCGYWKVWDNVEKEFRAEMAKEYKDEKGIIFKKAGEFSTDRQLRRAGRSDLATAVEYHGGLTAVRRKMKQDVIQVERGYWKDWNRVEKEFRAEMAKEYKDEKGVFKKAGEFPTCSQLWRAGRFDLTQAVARHHHGLTAVRIKMGQDVIQVEAGHWKDWDNVEKEFRAEMAKEYKDEKGVFKKAGEFPTQLQLGRAGRSYLAYAANEYHGGIVSVRRKMGHGVVKVENGHWKDWDNFEKEFRAEMAKEYKDEKGVFKKAGEFPAGSQLKRAGRFDLACAATSHHGSLNAVRRKMEQDIVRVENGHWKDWDNFEKEFRAEIAKEYKDDKGVFKNAGEFPIGSQLQRTGRSNLASAADRHHGGLTAVRRKMGYDVIQVEDGYWSDWNKVEMEFRAEIAKEYKDKDGVFKKAGEFPSHLQLSRANRSDLASAVSYHGGINAVRRKMGYDVIQVEVGYWKNWENVEKEFRAEIAKEYKDEKGTFKKSGEFPTQLQLQRADCSYLVAAAKYHGGLVAVKICMGFGRAGDGIEDAKAQIKDLLTRIEGSTVIGDADA